MKLKCKVTQEMVDDLRQFTGLDVEKIYQDYIKKQQLIELNNERKRKINIILK